MANRIRQSVCWWTFMQRDMTPEGLVRAAAEIGYEAVEIVPPEFWPLAKSHGLKIASIAGHMPLEEGFNRRELHDRLVADVEAKLVLAETWEIPNLICFSGNRNGLDDKTGLEICAEGLRRVAKQAENAGVNLVVELLNSKVDHPDYQCDHTDWGVRLCRMVDSPRVKLLYDIYHMQIMEGDLLRTIRTHHGHVAHYHTAGNPGRHDLDEHQEINYPPIMRAILETGYDGFVGQEFVPKGDVVEALRAAFLACDV